MKHNTTRSFWSLYDQLPDDIQQLADENYELLRANPRHPSLRLKKIGPRAWSARVGVHHRVIASESDGGLTWIWIGTHADYDALIRRG